MNGAQLDEALRLPLETLLEHIGREVHEPRLIGALPLSPFVYISAARQWMDDRRETVCAAMWKDPRVAAFLRGQISYQITELSLVLIDILRTVLSEPTCGWAAVYFARSGLNQMCPEKLLNQPSQDNATSAVPSPIENRPAPLELATTAQRIDTKQ